MEFSSNDLKMLFDDLENLSKDDLLGIPFIIGNTSLKNDCFIENDKDKMNVSLNANQFDNDSFIQLRTYVNQCLNRANIQDKCQICNNYWCSDEIIKCANNNCENAVHESCYGLIPRDNQKRWYCWNCINATTISCAICLEKGGILKPTDSGQYCHVICAIFTPETSLADNPMLEPIIGIKNISKERYTLPCTLCNRHKGACIQCCYGKCTTSFHPLCAMKSKLLLISDNGIPFVAYCNKHMKLIQKSKIKYCICNKESIENDFYIECVYGKGGCNGWIHPECIGMTKEEAEQLENYICPLCKPLYEKEESEKEKNRAKLKELHNKNNIHHHNNSNNNNNNNKSTNSSSSSRRNLRKSNRMRCYEYFNDDDDDLSDNNNNNNNNNNPFPLSSEFCDNSWDIISQNDLTLRLRLTNELLGLNYVNENINKRNKDNEEEEEETESESDDERVKDKGEKGDDDYSSSESNSESESENERKRNRRRSYRDEDSEEESTNEESGEEESDEGEEEEEEEEREEENDSIDEKDEEKEEKVKGKKEKVERKMVNNRNKSRSRNREKEKDTAQSDEYESLFYYTSTWKIVKQKGLNLRLKLTGSVLDKNNKNNDDNEKKKTKKKVDDYKEEMEEELGDELDDNIDNSEEETEEEEEEKPKKRNFQKKVIKKKTPPNKRVSNKKNQVKRKRDNFKDDDDWSDSE